MNFNTRLIELVKSYEYLYDSNNENPGVHARRDSAWKEIARRLQAEESECKKAWLLLREGYRRVLKRRKAAERDPVHRKDKVIPKWTFEDELSFLKPHLKHRTRTHAQNKASNSPEKHDNIENQENPEAVGQHSLAKRSRTQESTSRRTCANETYSNTLIKYILEKTTKRDDIQNFFDSVSSTVHTFPPRDRIIAKAKVFEVISQMELEILGRQSSSAFQYESSPASCEASVTKPQNDSFNSQSPGAPSPVLIDSESSDEEMEPVLDVKVEHEPRIIIKFEPET